MVSLTEKTCDLIAEEFRGLVKSIDDLIFKECKNFYDLEKSEKEIIDSADEEESKKDVIEGLMLAAKGLHDNRISSLTKAKEKYSKLIEVLMIGETA